MLAHSAGPPANGRREPRPTRSVGSPRGRRGAAVWRPPFRRSSHAGDSRAGDLATPTGHKQPRHHARDTRAEVKASLGPRVAEHLPFATSRGRGVISAGRSPTTIGGKYRVSSKALEEPRDFPPSVVGRAQRQSAPRPRSWRVGGARRPRGARHAFTSARASRAWCRGMHEPVGAARAPARDAAGAPGSGQKRTVPRRRRHAGPPRSRRYASSPFPPTDGWSASVLGFLPLSPSTGRTDLSDRSGASRRRTLLRTGRASFPASGSSKPWWLVGGQKCRAVAVGVYETVFSLVRRASRLDDRDRRAGGGQPCAQSLGVCGCGRRRAGSCRSGSIRPGLEEPQAGVVDRQDWFASSPGPVVGQRGVVG